LPNDAQVSFLLRARSTIKSMNTVFDPILVRALSNRTRSPNKNWRTGFHMAINRSI
jgi:hypothetical protein